MIAVLIAGLTTGCQPQEEVAGPELLIQGTVQTGKPPAPLPDVRIELVRSVGAGTADVREVLASALTNRQGWYSIRYSRLRLPGENDPSSLSLRARYEGDPNDCISREEPLTLSENPPDTIHREFRLALGNALSFYLVDDPNADLLPECCWQAVIEIKTEDCDRVFPGPSLVLDEVRRAGRFMIPSEAGTVARWTLLDPDIPGRVFITGSQEIILTGSDSLDIPIFY